MCAKHASDCKLRHVKSGCVVCEGRRKRLARRPTGLPSSAGKLIFGQGNRLTDMTECTIAFALGVLVGVAGTSLCQHWVYVSNIVSNTLSSPCYLPFATTLLVVLTTVLVLADVTSRSATR